MRSHWNFLVSGAFKAVLLELDLPKRNGVEILDALEDPPPVVIVSGYTMDPEDYERFGGKVVGHLRKPVEPRLLIDTVTAVVC